MTLSSQPLPTIGAANATEDSKIRSLLSELQGIVNGGIDSTNITDASVAEADLAAALTTRLGLTASGRGKSIITTTESRSSTAYGTLTTPDKVTITLPTDGLVAVAYQATWQESVAGAGRASIFVGANQLRVGQDGVAGGNPQEAGTRVGSTNVNVDGSLATFPGGLASAAHVGSASDATTGQVLGVSGMNGIVTFYLGGNLVTPLPAAAQGFDTQTVGTFLGGPCYIFAAAGTYDITVQFKASSGTVTAKNRKLWAWTLGF